MRQDVRIQRVLRRVGMLHLCRQQPRQVNLWHHLAAALALLLVPVVVVLDQVPNFDSALQVRGQHGHAGMGAVRAGRRGAEWHIHTLHRKTRLLYSICYNSPPAVCKKRRLFTRMEGHFPDSYRRNRLSALKPAFERLNVSSVSSLVVLL